MNKISCCLGLLFLFTSVLSAQDTFDWGLNLYPNYSDRRLISFNAISDSTILLIDQRENGRFSYSAGLIAGWRGKKASFNFGLNYMNTGYQTVKEPIPADDPAPEGADSRRFVFQNTNLEVPLEVNFYQELSPGTEFYFMLGWTFSYNLNNRIKTIYFLPENRQTESVTDETEEFRKFNYGFQTGIGMEKTFSDRYALVVGPQFQFWFKGVYAEDNLNRSLYSFGLKIAFKFKTGGFQ